MLTNPVASYARGDAEHPVMNGHCEDVSGVKVKGPQSGRGSRAASGGQVWLTTKPWS
jgi:hypothetical protein